MSYYSIEIEACQNSIKELRKKQVQIQNRIQKQEENDIFDESLYDELDRLDGEINKLERQKNRLEKETE